MPAPKEYRCGECGVSMVRLFRDYNTILEHQTLTCRDCTIMGTDDPDKERDPDETSIGWKVAAVPDILPTGIHDCKLPEGSTFWGYTSVPNEAVAWWKALPNRATLCIFCSERMYNGAFYVNCNRCWDTYHERKNEPWVVAIETSRRKAVGLEPRRK